MTDDQIIYITNEVDLFVSEIMHEYKIDIIDISAIINARLRMISSAEGSDEDYDALLDHLNSQTIVLPKTIH